MLKLFVASFLVVTVAVNLNDAAPVYQYLAPRAGYVPVYIRFGDTPLSDINPELDEAFHEGNIRPMEVATNDQPITDDDIATRLQEVKESFNSDDSSVEAQPSSYDEDELRLKRSDPAKSSEESQQNHSSQETHSSGEQPAPTDKTAIHKAKRHVKLSSTSESSEESKESEESK